MYYAYSISLMYFLRAKNNNDITENIFNKLKLEEEQRIQLQNLLYKRVHQEFTAEEIELIIEPILGRAMRNLVAKYTKEEFVTSPQDTPLFTASKYGLEYYLKQALQNYGSDLHQLINNEFTNSDYTEAEIYRVEDVKTAMQEFATIRLPFVLDEFNNQWAMKRSEFEKQNKQLTPSDIQFHQTILLDSILMKETVQFFSVNDHQQLEQYIKHLQQENVWGTEEALMSLHRAIQGEHMVRNHEGTIDTLYDTEIVLHLHKNNQSLVQKGSPELVVNNMNNRHWTSKIPETIFDPKSKVEADYKDEAYLKLPLKVLTYIENQIKTINSKSRTIQELQLMEKIIFNKINFYRQTGDIKAMLSGVRDTLTAFTPKFQSISNSNTNFFNNPAKLIISGLGELNQEITNHIDLLSKNELR